MTRTVKNPSVITCIYILIFTWIYKSIDRNKNRYIYICPSKLRGKDIKIRNNLMIPFELRRKINDLRKRIEASRLYKYTGKSKFSEEWIRSEEEDTDMQSGEKQCGFSKVRLRADLSAYCEKRRRLHNKVQMGLRSILERSNACVRLADGLSCWFELNTGFKPNCTTVQDLYG